MSAINNVRLVAGREIATRLRTRSFVISNAVLLVVIVVGIVLAAAFTGGPDEPTEVGLVGGAGSLEEPLTAAGDALGEPVATSTVADEQTARDAVAAEDLEAALVPDGDGYRAVTRSGLSDSLNTVITAAVQQQATTDTLTSEGVDPSVLQSAVAAAQVRADELDPAPAVDGERLALAFVAIFLLYFQLLTNGIAVAMGVVEEKTSRVVEVLLSTIKPVHLLAGKVLGIGVVGFVSLAAYGAVALIAATATGLLNVTGTAVAVFAATLGWYVLGYAFFAVLYAATGSMVSRQEEINSTTTPLTFLVLAMVFLAQFTATDPDGTVAGIMSWIPPFSAILMPLRIAAGVAGPVQIVATILLMVLVTWLFALVAAKIYERSVLRTGTRVSWRQALGR